MSVIFVAHTEKSEMAKRMREKLAGLEKIGKLKFEIVEKTGNKLENILHNSNAWGIQDCERNDFILCESAGENDKKGQWKNINVVYETYCLLCEEREENKFKEVELYNGEKKKRKNGQ